MKFIITSSSSPILYKLLERYHELLNESGIEVQTEERMVKEWGESIEIDYVEINTLEDLSVIMKNTESSLVVSEPTITEYDGIIEIYDGYRE